MEQRVERAWTRREFGSTPGRPLHQAGARLQLQF
jgi:hypothetical protein